MAVFLSPIGNDAPFVDSSGNPLSGGLLYTYEAGSATPATTYTTSAGSVANANPIVLSANGYPASGGSVVSIWLTATQSYKFTLKTSAGVEVWSRDNIDGINDQSVAIDEWLSGPTATYTSATTFTVVGDQTTTFHEGRRLKIVDAGGTKYFTITGSAYTTLTTVTVAGDSLSTPITSVSYSLISASNSSIAPDAIYKKGASVASAATCDIWNTAGDYLHITGNTGPITSFGTAPYAGAEKTLIFDSTPTITHNGTSLLCPGGIDIAAAANDRAVIRADTTANMVIVDFIPAAVALAASDTAKGPIEIAVQSEMETGTSTTLAVTPGRQHFHPGHPKCWAYVTVSAGTPTLQTSYNITSITDTGGGELTITIATDFSTANWCHTVATRDANAATTTLMADNLNTKAAGSILLNHWLATLNAGPPPTSALADPTEWNFIGMGDQA
jgi:hypothetical protein